MSNRPARISQAEIERAIRAARKAGATEVELKIGVDVSIRIRIPLAPDRLGEILQSAAQQLDDGGEVLGGVALALEQRIEGLRAGAEGR